jgi:hypothetical protein
MYLTHVSLSAAIESLPPSYIELISLALSRNILTRPTTLTPRIAYSISTKPRNRHAATRTHPPSPPSHHRRHHRLVLQDSREGHRTSTQRVLEPSTHQYDRHRKAYIDRTLAKVATPQAAVQGPSSHLRVRGRLRRFRACEIAWKSGIPEPPLLSESKSSVKELLRRSRKRKGSAPS